MTDQDLTKYIERYGDRLAIKAFCQQRSAALERPGSKSSLMQRVRDKIQGNRNRNQTCTGNMAGRHAGNKHATKDTRRIEMGWLHFSDGNYHQVRTRHGGGTRHLSVQKTVTMEELLETGKNLFFLNGHSSKGEVGDFEFDIRDFSHKMVPLGCTVNELYEQTKIKMLRIYLCTREKEKEDSPTDVILSDTSSDFEPSEPSEDRSAKNRRKQIKAARSHIIRKSAKKSERGNQFDPKSSDSDTSPSVFTKKNHGLGGESSKQSRPHSELHYIEILHSPPPDDDDGNNLHLPTSNQEVEDDCPILAFHEETEQLVGEPNPHLAQAINASLEDFEIQFGPHSGDDGASLDSTLPWNPDTLDTNQHSTWSEGAASSNIDQVFQTPPVMDIRCVSIRRINVVQDLIDVFMDPEVLNTKLKMDLNNEKGFDSDGVSREVYSAFWELFLEQCEGEEERVPRLRPDFTQEHWEAVGRVWLKGYLDHGIIPIQLSPAFVLAFCQGVSSVDEERLMMSFNTFISGPERMAVEKALQNNMDETVEEDLLDLFSRMGSHCLPSGDHLRASLLTMAHKVLLQEPKFIIDCFHSIIHNVVPPLTEKDIMNLYESKKPTNKKVAQTIKPTVENLDPQQQSAFNHLVRYVRSAEQKKLEKFLRFCTGSTVLCQDKIEVTFNRLSGLSRRLVAHTCGAVLELPCTYSSYPEFRAELDNTLSGDCYTMDIL
ncbi:uncharacterized protein LOC111948006 isoform X1 [Oryzias latipes]|uniref:uncharacterized protein LOC110015142 isoform X1 n=1 Tax=Oryzias latipes TaxID=8090 RepID=UPI000CE1D9CF|nr:uncharacterized protein LOC110015142 isoform X1 [Oryzias latipes]XP_023814943.1 uncharacterized protein LOC111948006 isoform X1 [Oryzias latipes]